MQRLGIESFGQRGAALDIGEEDRDLLAFALHRRACSQYALGQVVGRVVSRVDRHGYFADGVDGAAAAIAKPGISIV